MGSKEAGLLMHGYFAAVDHFKLAPETTGVLALGNEPSFLYLWILFVSCLISEYIRIYTRERLRPDITFDES